MEWLTPTYGWWLAAVPVAALCYGWARRARRRAMAQFGEASLVQELAASVRPRRRTAKAVLTLVALALLGVALAGPRFGTSTRTVERKGVDLVVALDVSTSMRAEDVAPNRLERAKNEIKNVLNRLGGDRVGLVVFAGDGFVQCPLTTDYNAVRLFLDVADTDLIPTPGTNFRAAMQAAVQAFDTAADTARTDTGPSARRSRALLVVSDGENHVGDLDAVKETARENRIALFTAGVGETDGATIPVYEQGSQVGVKRDRQGSVVRTRLDEASLTSLAEQGAYFRITRTSSALPDFREALRELEQTSFGAETFSEYAEMYQWPLAAGLALLFLEMLIPARATASD